MSAVLWCWSDEHHENMAFHRTHAAIAPAAHAQKFTLPAAAVTVIPTVLFGSTGLLGALATAAAVVWGITLLAAFVHEHGSALCLRCIEEVPVDASVRAQRRKRVLWFYHLTTRPVIAVVAIALLILAPSVLVLALHLQANALSVVPGILWGFACAFSARQHSQLRPWCSYCRGWDEGGDHEPSPDPVTFGTKTLH